MYSKITALKDKLQKLKENFKEAAAGLEFEVFTADIESKQNTSFAEFSVFQKAEAGSNLVVQRITSTR